MPYIKPKRREILNPKIDELFKYAHGKGEINYCITRLVHLWVMNLTSFTKSAYHILSSGHAVLQDAATEYYHAVMVPYEAKKKSENGPVSELDGGNHE